MLGRVARWVLAPIALALATTGLVATPSSAITGNYVPDNEHEYVGLIAFYDASGEFLHRCSGTLLSPTVFLTAGHCVTADDATGTLAPSARIWFEQDAGADYDPVTGEPASSGYPVTGGVTATQMYSFDYRGLTVPDTHDVGLVVLNEPVQSVYPNINTYADLAVPNTLDGYGSGPSARVTLSGYGLTYDRGHDQFITSYRSRLMANTWIIGTGTGLAKGFSVQLASNPGRDGGGTCFGDSGGPTLLYGTDVQVAVTSFGLNPTCTGTEFNFRVDTNQVQAWMESVLQPQGLWAAVDPTA
ncbi:MAG TPA: trypsin-like serine protease [Actinomycetes bacterium]|nr:trypsin-like serine protease [Actinomycetes bacterium]